MTRLDVAGIVPALALVHLGEHSDAASYRRVILQRASRLGIACRVVALPAATDDALLVTTLRTLNDDSTIHSVLIQTPISRSLWSLAGQTLDYLKDVEGITPGNLGRLMLGASEVLPCTAAAVATIIQSRLPNLRGKRVVIVNNSPTIGRPLAQILLRRGATVTVCHTGTVDLAGETRRADVLVSAIGHPHFFGPQHISPGTLVVDVGINVLPDGSGICGDVDTAAVLNLVSAITPVPGGVGPVTTALLMANTVALAGGLPE